MIDNDHAIGLFGADRIQQYSFVDMMDMGDEDDNSVNLLKYSPYYDENTQQQAFLDGNETLNILSLNCQSLNAKFLELQIYLETLRSSGIVIDVVCLQETWIANNEEVSHLTIENYDLISKGKRCSTHGGVAFYLHKNYKFKILEVLDSES